LALAGYSSVNAFVQRDPFGNRADLVRAAVPTNVTRYHDGHR
jgi:hypothetical protein